MRLAIVLSIGLLVPAASFGQGPGMGGGGAGGMRMDPERMIEFVFKGKDVLRVNEMNEMERGMWDRFASRLGLSGNEITKDQFRGAMEKAKQMAERGEFGEQARAAVAGGGMGGDRGGMGGDRRLDEEFKRLDRDEDGILRYDEMPEDLQDYRSRYDTNEDGVIDLGEFKGFKAATSPQLGADRGNGRGRGEEPAIEERKRPTILRAGSLPKDFPFASLDHDLDGQVGLYEWKEASKRISEFLSYDLNRDGFMTVEEYYTWKKQESGGGSTATAYTGGGIMDGNGRGNGNGESATPPAGKERAFGPGGNGGGGPGNGGGAAAWAERMRGNQGGGMTMPGGGMSFRPTGGGPGSGGMGGGDRMRGPGGGGEERRGPGSGGERRIELAIPGASGGGSMTLTPPSGMGGGPRGGGPKGENGGGPKEGGGRKEFGPRKKN